MKKLTTFFQFCLLVVVSVMVLGAVANEVVPAFAPRFNESFNAERIAMRIPLIDPQPGVANAGIQLMWVWQPDSLSTKPFHTTKVIKREGLLANSETDYYIYGSQQNMQWVQKTTYNWVTKKVTACSCSGVNGDNVDTCRVRLRQLMLLDSI